MDGKIFGIEKKVLFIVIVLSVGGGLLLTFATEQEKTALSPTDIPLAFEVLTENPTRVVPEGYVTGIAPAEYQGSEAATQTSVSPTPTQTPVPQTPTPEPPAPTHESTKTPLPASPTSPPADTTIPPTAVVEVAGRSLYEFQTPDGLQQVFIPTGFLFVLSKASGDVGKVEGFDFANLAVVEDTVFLGEIPLFLRTEDGWVLNPGVIYEPEYPGLGPALRLVTYTKGDPNASTRLVQGEVHSIQSDGESGQFTGISVYPTYLKSIEVSKVSVLTPGGKIIRTQVAEVTFEYFDDGGNVRTGVSRLYGSINIGRRDAVPFANDNPAAFSFASLVGGQALSLHYGVTSTYPLGDDTPLEYLEHGLGSAYSPADAVLQGLRSGTLYNIGWLESITIIPGN